MCAPASLQRGLPAECATLKGSSHHAIRSEAVNHVMWENGTQLGVTGQPGWEQVLREHLVALHG